MPSNNVFDTETYINELEEKGLIKPDCKFCQNHFYPQLREGRLLGAIHAPRHEPLTSCLSGKYPHCTCDSCF